MKNRCQIGDYEDALLHMFKPGAMVKRSDDMLRDLMLEIEDYEDAIYLHDALIGSTVEDRIKYFHLKLLVDAGYLEETGRHGGAFRMTNAGHDFVALIRSEGAWSAVKATAATIGGASVRMLGEIAYALAKEKLRALGLPLE
jgi:hypothetical protein